MATWRQNGVRLLIIVVDPTRWGGSACGDSFCRVWAEVQKARRWEADRGVEKRGVRMKEATEGLRQCGVSGEWGQIRDHERFD